MKTRREGKTTRAEWLFVGPVVVLIEAVNFLCYRLAPGGGYLFRTENMFIQAFVVALLLAAFRVRKRWIVPVCMAVAVLFLTSFPDSETGELDWYGNYAYACGQLMAVCPMVGGVDGTPDGIAAREKFETYLGCSIGDWHLRRWASERQEDYYEAQIVPCRLAAQYGKVLPLVILCGALVVFALLLWWAVKLPRGVFRTGGIWMVGFLAAPFVWAVSCLDAGGWWSLDPFTPSVECFDLLCARLVFWLVLLFLWAKRHLAWAKRLEAASPNPLLPLRPSKLPLNFDIINNK